MTDILFKTDDYIFSYRIAGICVYNGKVLLQTAPDDDGYAFPGGHSSFGETNEETLKREFKEEIGADISVGDLKWVAEVFFQWGNKPCHQICLYYMIDIESMDTPKNGIFEAKENINGKNFVLTFEWIPIDEIKNIKIYPANAAKLLKNLDNGVQHFIYKEN